MEYENNVVFPYIESLLRGDTNENFKISDFASKHESVVTKLNELKDIFLQHYSIPNTRMLNRALFNIAACGEDLVSHCEIEISHTVLSPNPNGTWKRLSTSSN